jgi:hypothetical protein
VARTLGQRFVNVAMRTVSFAGSCLRGGNIDQGLAELSAEGLYGAVRRAIELVATEAGVSTALVERSLPIADMDALLAQIEPTQAEAVRQWKTHMAHAGGLLEAIAKLTADARPAEAGLSLMRIATKMKLEKALAVPLRALASQIEQWCELLERMGKMVDDGKQLEAARQRRARMRMAAAGGAALLALAAGGALANVHFARERVAARLAAASPCDVELIDDGDLARASSDQTAAVRARKVRCSDARAAEQKARADRAAAEERAKRERAAKEQRDAACGKIASLVASPAADATLGDALKTVAGKHAELFERLVKGQLTAADVTGDLTQLPCLDSPAIAPIAAAYTLAAVRAKFSWLSGHAPSPSAIALLSRGKSAIGPEDRAFLSRDVEKRAEDALMTGNAERITQARALCAVLAALGVPPDLHCRAIETAG